MWLCLELLLWFVISALARLYWLVAEQAREHPEDPLYWSYEMEWLEGVIQQEGSGPEVEELQMFLSRLGFRPRESEGHMLYVDYLYVDGVAVAVPWRIRLKEVLRERLMAAVAKGEESQSGPFYPLCGSSFPLRG